MLKLFETMSQQCCNAVLRQKSSLRIVPCNITFKIQRRDGMQEHLQTIGLKSKTVAHASRFFVHFFAVFARLQRENA